MYRESLEPASTEGATIPIHQRAPRPGTGWQLAVDGNWSSDCHW